VNKMTSFSHAPPNDILGAYECGKFALRLEIGYN
jgi:hypothetical protein